LIGFIILKVKFIQLQSKQRILTIKSAYLLALAFYKTTSF